MSVTSDGPPAPKFYDSKGNKKVEVTSPDILMELQCLAFYD